MSKQGFIVEAKKTLDKFVDLDNTQEVLRQIRSDLNDALSNYITENEVDKTDFPVEFENEMGKWKIESNGETHYQPMISREWVEVNVTLKSTDEMSKERYNEIIDEVYDRYADSHWSEPINPEGQTLSDQLWSLTPMEHNKETFVNEIKCVKEFSEKWGLQIEERDLSDKERIEWMGGKIQEKYPALVEQQIKHCDKYNVPTKLITVTYKNEIIEIYE